MLDLFKALSVSDCAFCFSARVLRALLTALSLSASEKFDANWVCAVRSAANASATSWSALFFSASVAGGAPGYGGIAVVALELELAQEQH
jgi:hypothetical protein